MSITNFCTEITLKIKPNAYFIKLIYLVGLYYPGAYWRQFWLLGVIRASLKRTGVIRAAFVKVSYLLSGFIFGGLLVPF